MAFSNGRFLVILAPVVLAACGGTEAIISSRDQVVVSSSSAADASAFAQKHCMRFSRDAFYLREGRNSYWYICKEPGPVFGGRQLSRINPKPTKTMPPMIHSNAAPAVPELKTASAAGPGPDQVPDMKSYPVIGETEQAAASPPRSVTRPAAPEPDMKNENQARNQPAYRVATAAVGRHWVQVASRRSRKAAEAAEREVRKRNADLLGGAGFKIIKAIVRNSQTYYRLRFGPYADSSAAKDLCNELKSRKQDCFVIVRL